MEQLFSLFKLGRQANRISTTLFNYVPQRGARYVLKINWKEPEKYSHYHPLRSGDTATLTVHNPEEIHSQFRNSKEFENADEKVKKIFSLGYQKQRGLFEHYRSQLVEKVKEHPFDSTSRGVKIAELTAKIRHFQNMINIRPSKMGLLRFKIDALIGKRKAYLNKLRCEDYKKFEWILEVLELQFRPGLQKSCKKVTRKASLGLLAKLKAKKVVEEKKAALRKEYDEQKAPFLEKKLAKLKQIKEMEEKFDLPKSVSEEDIEKCMERLEKVKIEVAENARVGYLKKIHPFTLESYSENLLYKKEQAGSKIREQMELGSQNIPSKDTPL